MRRVAAGAALPALVLLFGSAPAFAFRPFDGTDASVADMGSVEIELGPLGYLRQGSAHILVAPAMRLNYGFAPGWEAVLEGDATHGLSSGSGGSSLVGDMLSAKRVLREGYLQEKSGPSIASEFALLLPGIGGDHGTGGSAAGIVSEQWRGVSFHLNAVAAITRQQHGDLSIGMIVEGPREWTVRPVTELFHERDFGGPTTTSGLLGAIWQLRQNLAFDAGLRHAWSDGHTADELRLGLSFAFGLP